MQHKQKKNQQKHRLEHTGRLNGRPEAVVAIAPLAAGEGELALEVNVLVILGEEVVEDGSAKTGNHNNRMNAGVILSNLASDGSLVNGASHSSSGRDEHTQGSCQEG